MMCGIQGGWGAQRRAHSVDTIRLPMGRALFSSFKLALLGLLGLGIPVSEGAEVYWREEWSANGNWDGELGAGQCDDMGNVASPWWYNGWSGGARGKPNCYGNHVVYFSNNSQLSMTLNNSWYGVNQIIFNGSTGSRTMNGSNGIDIYDSGAKIENQVSAAQTFNVPLAPHVTTEINPVSGDLAFHNNIWNNGYWINVYGDNNKTLTLGGVLDQGGGVAVKQNSLVILTNNNTFSGAIWIEKGRVQLGGHTNAMGASGIVNVGTNATLDLNYDAVTLRPATLNLYGTGTNASAGALRKTSSGRTVWPGDIALGADARIVVTGGGLDTKGTIAAGANTLYVTNTVDINMTAGAMTGSKTSGDGALYKSGSAAFTLRPDPALGGVIILNQGTIRLGAGTMGGNGALNMGAGTTLQSDGSDARTNTKPVTIYGHVTLGDAGAYNGELFLTNTVNLGNAMRTLSMDNTNTLSGQVIIGGLTKDGVGRLILSGVNTYDSYTIVSNGALRVANTWGLGAFNVGTEVKSGAALELIGGIATPSEPLILNGSGQSTNGALRNISGDNTYGGTVTLASDARINSDSGTLTLSADSDISGAGMGLSVGGAGDVAIWGDLPTGAASLTKDGSGTMKLYLWPGAARTWSGATLISAGTLQLMNADAISDSSAVTVSNNATLDMINGSDTIGSIAGGGSISMGNSTLTVGGDNSSTIFGGVMSGAGGALVKQGTGALTLTGQNTHGGNTTVNAGSLIQNGTNANSAVTVNSGAFLYGVGQVAMLTLAGQASAGSASNTVGQLAAASVNLQNNGRLKVDLSALTGAAGTDWDLVKASGDITVNAADGNDFVIALKGNPAFDGSQPYTSMVIQAAGAVNGFDGAKFTVDTTEFTPDLEGGIFSVSVTGSCVLVIFAPYVETEQAVWDGGGADSLWDNALNWVGNTVPPASSNILFYTGIGSGTNIYLNGDRTVAGLTFGNDADTAVNIRSNTLTINGQGIRMLAGADGEHVIASDVALGSDQSWTNDSASALKVSGVISGSHSLTKKGSGVLIVSGANIYDGPTIIDAGTVQLLGEGSAATTNSIPVANSSFESPVYSSPTYSYAPAGASWTFSAGAGIGNNASPWYDPVALDGVQAAFIQLVQNVSQTLSFPGSGQCIVKFLSVARGGALGPNQMRVQMDGNDILSWSPNGTSWAAYTATVAIASGGSHTLRFQGTTSAGDRSSCIDYVRVYLVNYVNRLPTNTAVAIASDAVLDLNGISQTVLSLEDSGMGGGLVKNGSTDYATLTIYGLSGSKTFNGVLADGRGTLALVKLGDNIQIFTGTSTNTGATMVSEGVLIQNGTNAYSAVTVNGGSFLYGVGQVADWTIAGQVSAGSASNTVGKLNAGAVNLQNNGILQVDISSMTGVAGTDWDLIDAGGAIAVNAVDGSDFVIALKGSPVFDPTAGYTNTIMTGSSVSGFVSNSFSITTTEFTSPLDGGLFTIREEAGSLLLVFSPPPPAQAVWDGEGLDSLWDTADNWVGGVVPDASSNCTFYIGLASGTNINLNGDRTVEGLTFNDNADTGLNIRSNTLTINGQGITVNSGAGSVHRIRSDIILGATQAWCNATAQDFVMYGGISGTGGLRKQGSGRVVISGGSAFTGGLWIDEGILNAGYTAGGVINIGTNALMQIAARTDWGNMAGATFNIYGTNAINLGAMDISGGPCHWTATINLFTNAQIRFATGGGIYEDGVIDANGHTLYIHGAPHFESGDIWDAYKTEGDGAIYKTGAGTFYLRPRNDMIGSIHVVEGTFAHENNNPLPAGGVLTLENGIAYSMRNNTYNPVNQKAMLIKGNVSLGYASANNRLHLKGPIDLDGGMRTLTESGATICYNTISNGGVTKAGAYYLWFLGTNTYEGGTIVSAGTLYSGTFGLPGWVTNNATLSIWQLETGTYSGVLSGSGWVLKEAFSEAILSGDNNFSGIMTVQGGILTITHSNALGATSAGTTVTNGCSLKINGGFTTMAEPLTLRGAGYGDIGALVNASSNNLFSGPIALADHTRIGSQADTLTLTNTITGSGFNLIACGDGTIRIDSSLSLLATGAVNKIDAGTLFLNGSSTNSGGTIVSAGTLIHNGTNTVAPVTVASGGTLMGAGQVPAVTVDGTIWPGGSLTNLGCLHVASLTMNNNSAFRFMLGNCADTSDRSYLLNDGATTIGSTVKVYPDSSRVSNWDSSQSYSWTLIQGGVSSIDNLTLDLTYWVLPRSGGTFSLALDGNNLVLNFTAGLGADIMVLGTNGVNILSGDVTPINDDGTDYGALHVDLGGSLTRTFTITNQGEEALTLENVAVGGAHAADFTIVAQPALSIGSLESSTFQVRFDPSSVGPRTATIFITNNVDGMSPYTFNVQGLGEWPGFMVRTSLVHTCVLGAFIPNSTFGVTNVGYGTLSYNLTTDAVWLAVSPVTGLLSRMSWQQHTIAYQVAGMAAGSYTGRITLTDAAASNSPKTLAVILTLTDPPNPNSALAVADGNEMIRLTWNPNSTYSNVMIVYRAGAPLTAPTPGQAYDVGDSCGGGTVIWTGCVGAANYEHIVPSGQTHYYGFYTVVSSYYSTGIPRQVAMDSYDSMMAEPFAYTNGVSLSGLNGGANWADAWSVANGAWSITNLNASPGFPNMPWYPSNKANRVYVNSPTEGTESSAIRHFAPVSGGSLYVCALMTYQYKGAQKWAGIELVNGTDGKAFVGKPWNASLESRFGLEAEGSQTLSGDYELGPNAGSGGNTGNVYLLVMKYNFSTRELSAIAYYRTNQVPSTEPTSWTVSRTLSSGYLTTANGVRLKAGSSSGWGEVGDVQFDEIRVSPDWNGLFNSGDSKVIYDWFANSNGRLNNQGGGVGWGVNTWQAGEDDNHVYAPDSFGANQWSCPTPQGHKIKIVATENGSSHWATRSFGTNFTSGKVYFSWMQNFDHIGGANSAYAGLYIMSNNQPMAFIGKVPGSAFMGLRSMGSTPNTNSARTVSNGTGKDYLFVARYDFATRELSANVYATNECVAEEPNGYWDVTATLESGYLDQITGVRLQGGVDSDPINNIGNVYFDEVRVGTNWYEVTRREGEEQAAVMIQGPIPRLLYVGTNYNVANNPQGSAADITITDAQLYNTADPLDFAVLWENVYGIWVTNANGTRNISSRNGPVSPNWDPVRKAGSVSTEVGYDAYFTNFVGANGANSVTTYMHRAFNITNATVNDTFYLSATAENLNDDGGSFNAPNGADPVQYHRALSVNTTMQFHVQDDDDALPLMGDVPLAVYRGDTRIGTTTVDNNLIAYWHMNSGSFLASYGTGVMTTTIGNYQWYTGSISNRVGTEAAGLSFGPNNSADNYKHFQFQTSMRGHKDLVVTYATEGFRYSCTNHHWSWSVDGTNFAHHTIIPKDVATNLVWSVQKIDLSNIPCLNGATTVYVRCTIMGQQFDPSLFDNVQFNAKKVVCEVTDEELVGIDAANPLRITVGAYDEYSGLSRDTADASTNTSLTIPNWLDHNVANFDGSHSSATSTGANTTNAWSFDSLSQALEENLLTAVSNEVWVHLKDLDADRIGDQREQTLMIGWLKVVDNDTNPPTAGTLQPGNLLRNPGFEEAGSDGDLKAKYWEMVGSIEDDDSPYQHGGYWGSASRRNWEGFLRGALCGTWALAGDAGGFWQEVTNSFGVGAVMEASAMVYNDATDTGHGLKIEFYDATQTNMLKAFTNQFADPGAIWTRVSMLATTPVNTAWIRWVIYAEGLGGDGAYSIDDVGLRVVTNTAMDVVHRGHSFYNSGFGTNALFVATDGDLASAASTDLFKFVFSVWDSNQVQRSTANEWLNYDLGVLGEFQNLYNNYRADVSSAGTEDSSSTSVFSHAYFTATYLSSPGAETGQIHQLLTAGIFPITVSGMDADTNRPGDESWISDRQFGRMQVVDDDTNGPKSWLLYAGSNYVPGITFTNTIFDNDLISGLDVVYQTYDPSGVFLTNLIANATNADGGAGGNINPNWDLVNPAGEELLSDVIASPENIHSLSGNGSLYVTTTLYDVQIPYAARTLGVWRIQASSQDADSDRGYYNESVDGRTHQVSFDRASQIDEWMQFTVIDDDTNHPTFLSSNLLENGSFEVNDFHYGEPATNWVVSWGGHMNWINSNCPGGGNKMVEMYTWQGYDNSFYETYWRPIRATEGKWYYFSIWCRKNVDGYAQPYELYIKMECFDSDDLYTGTVLYTNQINITPYVNTTWQKFTHMIKAVPGTRGIRMCFGFSDPSPSSPTDISYWDLASAGEAINPCQVWIGTSNLYSSSDGWYEDANVVYTNRVFPMTDEQLLSVSPSAPLSIRLGIMDNNGSGKSGLLRGNSDPAAEMALSIESLCTNNVANYRSNKSSSLEETTTIFSSNVWEFESFSVDQVNTLMSLGTVKIFANVLDADADRPGDQLTISNQQFGILYFADDDVTAPTISSLDVSGSALYRSGPLMYYDFGRETLSTNPTFALDRVNPYLFTFCTWGIASPGLISSVLGNPGRAGQVTAGWPEWGMSYFYGRFRIDSGFWLNLTNMSFDYHSPRVDIWSFSLGRGISGSTTNLISTNPPVYMVTNDLWGTMSRAIDTTFVCTFTSTWTLAGYAHSVSTPFTMDNLLFQGTFGPTKGMGYIGDADLAEGTCVITGLVRDTGNGLLSISEPLGPRMNIFQPNGSQLFTNEAFTTGPTVNGQGQSPMALGVSLPPANRAAIALGSYTGSVSVWDNDWDRPGDAHYTNVPLNFTVFDDDQYAPQYGVAFQFMTNLATNAYAAGAMAPLIGDQLAQSSGSGSNRIWYVTDKHMVHAALTNVDLHFNLYDLSGYNVSSTTGGSNMTVNIDNYATANYANYNADRSSLNNANDLFATSVWSFASFSDAQMAALMDTTSRVSVSVTDRDTDRPNDSMGFTDWQMGYIAWRDNDASAPALQTLRNTNASLLVWLGGTGLLENASNLWSPPTPQTNIVSSNQIFNIYDGQLAGVSATNILQFRFQTYDLGRDDVMGLQRGTTLTTDRSGRTLTNTSMSVGSVIANNTANFRDTPDFSSSYEQTKDVSCTPTSTWVYTSFTYDQVGQFLPSGQLVQSNKITLAAYDADNDRNFDQTNDLLAAGWLVVHDDDTNAPVTGSCSGTLLHNSSFELQGGTAHKAYGWDYWNPDQNGNWWGTATRESWRARSGTHEMALNAWSPGTNAGIWQQAANTSPDGTLWNGSAWFWSDNGVGGGFGLYVFTAVVCEVKIEFFDAGFNLLHAESQSFDPPGETWTQVSISKTSPVGTAWARFVVAASGMGSAGSAEGGALQIDDVMFGPSLPLAVKVGDVYVEGSDSTTNALFTVMDSLMGTNALRLLFGGYDAHSGLSRGNSSATTQMNVSVQSLAVNNVNNYDASESSADSTTNGSVSVWKWNTFNGTQVDDMIAAGPMKIQATLHDRDLDRANDYLTAADKQYGYLQVVDDDTNAPVASNLRIKNGVQVTDGDIRFGLWNISMMLQDYSEVALSTEGEYFAANYSLINPEGTMVQTDIGWTYADQAGESNFWTVGRAAPGVAYTDVLTGRYSVVWSATDKDNDRTGDRLQMIRSTNVLYTTNTFLVFDDDTTEPTTPSNIVLAPYGWTNVNRFVMSFDPSMDGSGIYEYRVSTNADQPMWVTNGEMLAATYITNFLPTLISNASFEVGSDELSIPADPLSMNSWRSFSSDGGYMNYASDEGGQDGSLATRHILSAGTRSDGSPRYTLCAQDVYLNNSNRLRPFITFSGWFKGNLSRVGVDNNQAAGFLKAEGFNSISDRTWIVVNEWNEDHNGAPLVGVNATDWTPVVLTVTNASADTEFIRFSCGISGHYSQMPCTGFWDHLSVTVSVQTIGGVIYTNAPNGITTNWFFAVDDDDDRMNDRLKSGNTNFVIMFDGIAPTQVMNVVAQPGAYDDTSEIDLTWSKLRDGGGKGQDPLSPWKTYKIYYTDDSTDPTTNSPCFTVNEIPTLGDRTTESLTLTDLYFGVEYRVAIVGVDSAGNEGPLPEPVNVQLAGFFVTQGVANASTEVGKADLYWTATEGREYDLIYADAANFSSTLSNRWKLVGRGIANMLSDTGCVTEGRVAPKNLGNNMRFYRATQKDRWSTNLTRRIASEEVYVLKSVRLNPGINWVAFPGIPDTCTAARVLGYNLPSGISEGLATRVYWFNQGTTASPTQTIWLSSAPLQWQWGGSSENADNAIVPLSEGMVIEIPTNELSQTSLFIGRVPTNVQSQTIEGGTIANPAFNLVSFAMPRNVHPNDMNLLASGFKGGDRPSQSDKLLKYDRLNQRIYGAGIWYKTSDSTWREAAGPNGAIIGYNYFTPDDGIVIVTVHPDDWVWTNKILYTLPTRFMNP
jgi:autotransporter-associated beta strand protein